MSELRVGVIGAGFWARYQILAWQQMPKVRVTAITNRTIDKAEDLAADLGIARVAKTPQELVSGDDVDVVDIITSESTHHAYTLLAAAKGKHVIAQKPMAETFEQCRDMVEACDRAGVRLFVHDNWRWQTPIRRLLDWYRDRPAGEARRARFSYLSGFPVFDLQPRLREEKRFILIDMGPHLIDTARAFLGDLSWVFGRTATVTPGVAGEDLATVVAGTRQGAHCIIELSYASPTENEHDLETLIQLECDSGVMELGHDFRTSLTKRGGRTIAERFPPEIDDWHLPQYGLSMRSCLPANQSFAEALATGEKSETDGRDYLNTMEAVFAAYESAASGRIVNLDTGA